MALNANETIKQARNLGKIAFRNGLKCVPAQHPAFVSLLPSGTAIGSNTVLKMLDAWLAGWTEENLKLETIKCKGCREEFGRLRGQGPYCDECSTVEVFQGYTRAELSEAFDKVKDKKHWKNPIDITLPLTTAEVCTTDAAIGFYAGGGAEFTPVGEEIRVKAPGYYILIGA